MKKRVLILIILAVAAAGVVLGARAIFGRKDDGALVLSGSVEASEVELSFRLPGRIAARPAAEGEVIHAGDVVARLDDTELRQQVDSAAAERDAARAALALLEAGTRAEEVDQARGAVGAAAAEAERARLEAVRARRLLADNVISRRELETAEAAARASAERARQAQAQLTLLRNGPTRETIDEAQARVRQAEAALATAQTRLSWTTLTAPLSGLVLAEHVEPAEQVAAATPVVTVADLRQVWVRAFVDETDLGRIHLGMPVVVRTDTFPDKRYRGRIAFIAADAEFTPKSVQTEKERVKLVYRVKVDVENPAFELKPGMPAESELAAGKGER